MLDVKIKSDDIEILNVERKDIPMLFHYMKSNKLNKNLSCHPVSNEEELRETFIECYLSECEFFIKVMYKNKLRGVLKGRAEFKNPNEIWLLYFLKFENENIDFKWGKIITKLENYFFMQYGIDKFYVIINRFKLDMIKIFKDNGFVPIRIYKKVKNGNLDNDNIVFLK